MQYIEQPTQDKCDKYDFLIAAFSGTVAGLIDVFFIGVPTNSILGTFTDKQADQLVKKFAKMVGWNPSEKNRDNIASAIGFLEKKFPVNYDQAHSGAVGGAFKMAAKNHHYKSLGHSPSIVGLFFSILDQFQGQSSFINDGKLIRIKSNKQNLELYGSSLPAKIFCGFVNWFGHIMSDMAGSSGGRGSGNGRGSGVPIPFMELFQLCNFGELTVGQHRQSFAVVMTQVFQEGYDLRHGATMSIPVLVNELIIKALWSIKRHFYHKKAWRDCIPSKKYSDLRLMLIIGNGTLCAIDAIDATVRSGGNAVLLITRLNLVGWTRLIILVFNELKIRYGNQIMQYLAQFLAEIQRTVTPRERKLINDYYVRMQTLDEQNSIRLSQFMEITNKEYLLFQGALDRTLNNKLNTYEQALYSEEVAKHCNVSQNKVIRTKDDLDQFFLG